MLFKIFFWDFFGSCCRIVSRGYRNFFKKLYRNYLRNSFKNLSRNYADNPFESSSGNSCTGCSYFFKVSTRIPLEVPSRILSEVPPAYLLEVSLEISSGNSSPLVFQKKNPLRVPVGILSNVFYIRIDLVHSKILSEVPARILREFHRSFGFGNSCRILSSTCSEKSCASFSKIHQKKLPRTPPEVPSVFSVGIILKDLSGMCSEVSTSGKSL